MTCIVCSIYFPRVKRKSHELTSFDNFLSRASYIKCVWFGKKCYCLFFGRAYGSIWNHNCTHRSFIYSRLHIAYECRKRKCLGFFPARCCACQAKVAQKLRFLERVLLHSTIDITFMIVPTRLLSRKIFCLGHKRQYYKPSSEQEFFHAAILKGPQVAKLGRI